MGYRIAIQLFIFALPFIAFGIYLLLIADAEEDGRRKWPIQTLFITGFVLSSAAWLIGVALADRSDTTCHRKAQLDENGQIIQAESYDCEPEPAPFND